MNVGISAIDYEAEAKAKALHKAIMQGVAEKIVAAPPSWLADILQYWSFEMKSAASIAEVWPSAQELRDKYHEIFKMTDELRALIQAPGITGFMRMDAATERDALQVLQWLQTASAHALQSPVFGGKGGKLPKGRGKPLLSNTTAPAYLCAAVIAEIFQFFYADAAVKPAMKRSYFAAHAFWCACFKDNSWGTDPLTRWKGYFSAIEKPEYASIRKEVRRILNIDHPSI